MAMRAGQLARKGGLLECQACGSKVRVEEGQRIPQCPNGHQLFQESQNLES